jgi:predicted anti-sigma-YlaC factor YlaD
MWDYNHKSISTDQAKPMGDFVTVATTIGAIAAGIALFEVALIPGMAIGAAAVLAPKYVPKRLTRK